MVGSVAIWLRGHSQRAPPLQACGWDTGLPARQETGAALGPAQPAADGRPLDGAAFVGNADAVAARPRKRAMALRGAVKKVETLRQIISALQLKLRAACGKIDDLAFDRLRVWPEQESPDARDQPLRRDPEPTSFVGPAHAQLCDKPHQCI